MPGLPEYTRRGNRIGCRQSATQADHSGGTHMSTITVKDGTTIYYKDWGKGPVVTFSHGWPLNSDMWDGRCCFSHSKVSELWHTIVVAMADPARRGPETTWTGMRTISQR
jgi:hypothetical protein